MEEKEAPVQSKDEKPFSKPAPDLGTTGFREQNHAPPRQH
jgi:hypothetical protein